MSYLAKKILGGPQGGGGLAAARRNRRWRGGRRGSRHRSRQHLGRHPRRRCRCRLRCRRARPGGLGDILGGGQPQGGQPRDALVPGPMNDSTSQQPAEPLGQPTRQSGAPVPGEHIEVDLPDGPNEKPEDGRKNDDGGDAGLGGLLGGLFGKKWPCAAPPVHRIRFSTNRFSTNAGCAGRHSSLK